MILLEGSGETGMTTGQWWENQGKSYKGNLKDESYYVYQDKSGQQRFGDVTFPGDPYTYEETSDGRLRVLSGPSQKSIGAVIQKPDRQEKVKSDEITAAEKVAQPTPKQAVPAPTSAPKETKKADGSETTKLSIDDIIMSISRNIRLMSLYLIKSLTYMFELKNICLEKSPNQIIPIIQSLGDYIKSNKSNYDLIIQELTKLTRNTVPDYTKMNIVQLSPTIVEIESLVGQNGMQTSFMKSLQYLGEVKKGIKALQRRGTYSWENVSPVIQTYFTDTFDFLRDKEIFLNEDAAKDFLALNVSKQGSSYVRMFFGAGVSKEAMNIDGQSYSLTTLRKDLERDIQLIAGNK
jgi:hypothetical protein